MDSAGDVGKGASLVLDSNGNQHVSYYYYNNNDYEVRYASRTGESAWNYETVFYDMYGSGFNTSLDIYHNPGLGVSTI